MVCLYTFACNSPEKYLKMRKRIFVLRNEEATYVHARSLMLANSDVLFVFFFLFL